MEAYTSLVCLYSFPFAVRNWGLCEGTLIATSANSALFSLLGYIYGRNGNDFFALPDLRGRAAIGFGAGVNLQPVSLGDKKGEEFISLTTDQLPAHSHTISVSGYTSEDVTYLPVANSPAISTSPVENYLGVTSGSVRPYAPEDPTSTSFMGPIDIPSSTVELTGKTENAGQGQPYYNRSPYLAMNYQICLQGIYPSRN